MYGKALIELQNISDNAVKYRSRDSCLRFLLYFQTIVLDDFVERYPSAGYFDDLSNEGRMSTLNGILEVDRVHLEET